MNWTAIFNKLLDPYEVKARLFPGLLVLLPAILFFALLYGRKSPAVAGLGAILAASGGPYLLSSFVRTWGLRAQDRLIQEWGAQPSTIMLRHRDTVLAEQTKLRYHALVTSRLGIVMPSADEEHNDPTAADQSYVAAADALRPLTNDRKEFPFVFKELVAYGFNRNAYGSRWFGLTVATFTMLATLIHANTLRFGLDYIDVSGVDNVHVIVLILTLAIAFLWCAHFTADTVRLSGFGYSRRLWEALEQVAKKHPRKARRATEPNSSI